MRRIGVLAACLVLLALSACTRRATTEPTETEPDPAAHWSAYALATGARRYEARVKLKGTIRLGEGFVQALAALSPPSTTPPLPERDLPIDVELTAALNASIRPEGENRLVTMTYERVAGRVDVAGVRRDVTAADLAAARGGTASFAYMMAPDGSVTPAPVPPDVTTTTSTTVPTSTSAAAAPTETAPAVPPAVPAAPVRRGLELSCPHPPPGGADPGQSWKIAEAVPLLGAAGALLATNTYTLEGGNSAVISSRMDAPLDTSVDLGQLAATNPVFAVLGGAAVPASAKLGGSVVTTTACELTWPEQELLARTLTGHQHLVLSFPGPAGPPAAVLGAGQFVVLDFDVTSELRSV